MLDGPPQSLRKSKTFSLDKPKKDEETKKTDEAHQSDVAESANENKKIEDKYKYVSNVEGFREETSDKRDKEDTRSD